MDRIEVISAGAARGLVEAVKAAYTTRTGLEVAAEFAPASVVRARCDDGGPWDVAILTEPLLDDLKRAGRISISATIGVVKTGIAVAVGGRRPAIDRPDTLRQSLLDADTLHCPDRERATSGIHFQRVLVELGIADAVADRVIEAPNGSAAMRALAQSRGVAIGCTQVSEIIEAPGVVLVGSLPESLGLVTTYCVGVGQDSARFGPAATFVEMLTAPDTLALRRANGFDLPH